jgi:site-specific DNA recombinase
VTTDTLAPVRNFLLGVLPREIAVTGVRSAVIYGRISQDRTGAGIKVAHQIADCRTMETPLGLSTADVLWDNDMSAYSGKVRPDFERLIEGLESGRWNVLLIWHTDRLYRSIDDLQRIVNLVESRGIEVHAFMGGKLDLSTTQGRMIARVLGVLSTWESEHRSERVVNGARGTVYRAKTGKTNGGERRYGFACMCPGAHEIVKYDADGKVTVSWHRHLPDEDIEAERAVVRWLTKETIKGARTGALAKQLRDRNVPTPRGGTWDVSNVKRLVIRPANAGLVLSTAGQPKGKRVPQIVRDDAGNPVRGQWDAIVSDDEWETARAILTDPARGRYHGRVPVSLLAGTARCYCGSSVGSGAHDRYVTRACGHVKRIRGPIDDLIRRVVIEVLASNKVRASDGTDNVIDNSDKIAVASAQLQRLEDRLADDDIDIDGYRRQRARKLAQIEALTSTQRVSRAPGVLVGVTAATFAELSLDRQRAIVAELLSITFRKTSCAGGRDRFDPSTIEITPRMHLVAV